MASGAAEQPIDSDWHCLSAEESLRRLGSTLDGLTSTQARQALARYGRNTITVSEAFSPWAIFLSQFKSVLIWVSDQAPRRLPLSRDRPEPCLDGVCGHLL